MIPLTAQEMKLVARLRKEERLWPRHRWWMLGLGSFIEVIYGYLLVSMVWHIVQEQSVHGGLAQSGLLIDIIMLWPKSLLVLFVGAVLCLLVFYWGIETGGHLQPGEDAVEPMALFIAPFVLNLCYTLGWATELPARLVEPSLSPRSGPVLQIVGFLFSMFVISIPAVIWGGYRILQLVHPFK